IILPQTSPSYKTNAKSSTQGPRHPHQESRKRLPRNRALYRMLGRFIYTHKQGIHTKSSQVLTGLGEFTFLHTLTNIPMNERTLGVHEIELVAESVPCLRDGGGVGQQA